MYDFFTLYEGFVIVVRLSACASFSGLTKTLWSHVTLNFNHVSL